MNTDACAVVVCCTRTPVSSRSACGSNCDGPRLEFFARHDADRFGDVERPLLLAPGWRDGDLARNARELDHEAHLGIATTAEVDNVRHWREEVRRRLHLAAHGRQPFDDEAPRRVGSRFANHIAARGAYGRARRALHRAHPRRGRTPPRARVLRAGSPRSWYGSGPWALGTADSGGGLGIRDSGLGRPRSGARRPVAGAGPIDAKVRARRRAEAYGI